MAGAMLAVSHGQLYEFRTKVKAAVGEQLAKQLGDEVCMTLAMLDEATLKSLAATKEAKDLTKLASAIREEPGIINVLKGESRLAKILPLMKGGTSDDLKFATCVRTHIRQESASSTPQGQT